MKRGLNVTCLYGILQDIPVVRSWGCKFIRYQIVHPAAFTSQADFLVWLDGELVKLDAILTACAPDIKVLVDLHSPPPAIGDPAGNQSFLSAWRKMAIRYKNSPQVWGFDLLNEPCFPTTAPVAWRDLAVQAAKLVNGIDPSRNLIIESATGDPGRIGALQTVAAACSGMPIIYSFHMYSPFKLTMQGLQPFPQFPICTSYPTNVLTLGMIQAAMEPVVTFQKQTKAPILMGEFSCVRWAPNGSALRYMTDVINYAEAHGWHWAYHCFRENQCWSVEYDENQASGAPAAAPGLRETLLRNWFAK